MTRVETTPKTEKDSVERKVAGFFRNSAEYFRHNWRKIAEVASGTAATIALAYAAFIITYEYKAAFFIAPLPIKTLAAGLILIPAVGALIAGAYTASRLRN